MNLLLGVVLVLVGMVLEATVQWAALMLRWAWKKVSGK